jgi:HEAT repeat protein
MKHRTLLVSSCLLLAAGASGAIMLGHRSLPKSWVGAGPSLESSSRSPSAGEEPTLPAAPPALSRAGWEPGVEYVYDIDYQTSFGQAEGEDGNAEHRIGFRLRGQWRTRVADSDANQAHVTVELASAKLETDTGANVPAEVNAALSSPFVVDYDAHGRALQLRVKPGLDATVVGVFRELVSATQLSASEAPAAHWTALETDMVGEYRAAYRAVSSDTFLREKQGYVRLSGRGGLTPADASAPAIKGYAARLRVDDWGRLATLMVTSDVVKPVVGGGLGFESKTTLALQLVSRSRNGGATPLPQNGLVATTLSPNERDYAEAAESGDRGLVAGASVDSLLKELDPAKSDPAHTGQVKARLAALFRLDASAIATARARLNHSNAQAILGALAEVGSAEAQQALASVLTDPRCDTEERKTAVDAMLGLEHPTRQTGEALKESLASNDPELRNSASLMLGTVAGRLAADDPAAAHSLVQRLSQDYGATNDLNEQLRVVGSLGNTRSADALPVITQSLGSQDPALRAGAAAALRLVPGNAADSLLSNMITHESDPSVRSAALMAAGYRSYEPLAGALEAVAHGTDSNARNALVSTLSNMATHDNQSLQLLGWMAEHDPDAKVRAQAEGALQHLPPT